MFPLLGAVSCIKVSGITEKEACEANLCFQFIVLIFWTLRTFYNAMR